MIRRLLFASGKSTLGYVFETTDEFDIALNTVRADSSFLALLLLGNPSLIETIQTNTLNLYAAEKLLYLNAGADKIVATESLSYGEQKRIQSILRDIPNWYGLDLKFDDAGSLTYKLIGLKDIEYLRSLGDTLEDLEIFLVEESLFLFCADSELATILKSEFFFSTCSTLLKYYCSEHGKALNADKLKLIVSEG